ncbi:MAG: hypothetical protein K9G44_03650 [Melioribacteraceae bacterium]|nr:hypothetical protein [Melioribacteraceae bacterium]
MKKNNLVYLAQLFLAATFIFSAYSKIVDIGLFELIIINQGLVGDRANAAVIARLVVGLEFAIGLLLIQRYFIKTFVSPLTLVVLGIFSLHLLYLIFIGEDGNCGCFGEMIAMSPLSSLLKNVVLILIVLYVWYYSKQNTTHFWIPILLLILALPSAFIYSPQKTNTKFEFSGYTQFENRGNVDLSVGTNLIAIFNTECDHCQEAAMQIGELKNESKNFPDFYTLFFSEGEITVDSFQTLTNSEFPYVEINSTEFFNLIGNSPPRIYLNENGSTKAKWDDNFVSRIKENFNLEMNE